VSIHAATATWAQHSEWPDKVGKRGLYKEDDAKAVAYVVRGHVERQAAALEPQRLYTVQQLGDAGLGITAAAVRAAPVADPSRTIPSTASIAGTAAPPPSQYPDDARTDVARTQNQCHRHSLEDRACPLRSWARRQAATFP
jgi:hypothetical protein